MSSFGAPPTTKSGFTFGTLTNPPSAGSTLGQPTSGFGGFAAPAPSGVQQPASTGFSFGTNPPTSAPNTGFSFGAPGPAQPQAAPTQQTSTLALNLTGTIPTQPQQQQHIATPAPGAFTGFGLQQKTAAPPAATSTSGFSFGASAPLAASTTSASLNFGTTTTTAALGSFGGGGGLFGANKPINTSTTTSLPTLGGGLFGAQQPLQQLLGTQQPLASIAPTLTATAIAPAPSVGLGGVDLNATQPKSSEGKQDNIKVKDIIIPVPIHETVENLKNFIKQQKSISSDIARATIRKLQNVSGDIQALEWSLQDISNCVEKNYSQIKNLRCDTSKAIQSVEMAQRTHETPAGLQFENTMPLKYFQELVQKYEIDMLAFRNQVELTEKHMRSLTSPQSFSPDDLKRGLQQIHESFVALAGRLQEIHQKVEAQKEQYLNLRKYYLRDTTNVFADLETDNTDLGVSNISSGPTPFSGLTAAAGIIWQNNRSNNTATTVGNLAGFGTNTAGMTSNVAGPLLGNVNTGFSAGNKPLFGSGSTFGGFTGTSAFNLQTPPLGAKRNKQ